MNLKKVIIEKSRETGKFLTIGKSGVFHFSNDFIKESGFKQGDRIDFYQDEDRPKDWYIVQNETGQLTLRQQALLRGLVFNSQFMAKKIKESIGFDIEKSINLPIGLIDEGNQVYPIITAKFIKN